MDEHDDRRAHHRVDGDDAVADDGEGEHDRRPVAELAAGLHRPRQQAPAEHHQAEGDRERELARHRRLEVAAVDAEALVQREAQPGEGEQLGQRVAEAGEPAERPAAQRQRHQPGDGHQLERHAVGQDRVEGDDRQRRHHHVEAVHRACRRTSPCSSPTAASWAAGCRAGTPGPRRGRPCRHRSACCCRRSGPSVMFSGLRWTTFIITTVVMMRVTAVTAKRTVRLVGHGRRAHSTGRRTMRRPARAYHGAGRRGVAADRARGVDVGRADLVVGARRGIDGRHGAVARRRRRGRWTRRPRTRCRRPARVRSVHSSRPAMMPVSGRRSAVSARPLIAAPAAAR